MASSQLVLGHVGIGAWGMNVFRSFNALPNARVKTCCDLDTVTLRELHRAYPHVQTTSTFQDLIQDPDIRAVAIATPAETHFDFAQAALRAGKHVFVEKPMTLNAAHAAQLAGLAKQTKLKLMVGHLLQFHPAVVELRRTIEAGILRNISYIHCLRLGSRRAHIKETSLWDLAPHDVSLILYLLNPKVVSVSATGDALKHPVEGDTAFITIRCADGLIVHIHVSSLEPTKTRRLSIIAENGLAVFDDMEPQDKLKLFRFSERSPKHRPFEDALQLKTMETVIPRVWHEPPLQLQCQHFVDCLLNDQPHRSNQEHGRRVIEILHAAAAALQRGGAPIYF